jgi:hypothetical protein
VPSACSALVRTWLHEVGDDPEMEQSRVQTIERLLYPVGLREDREIVFGRKRLFSSGPGSEHMVLATSFDEARTPQVSLILVHFSLAELGLALGIREFLATKSKLSQLRGTIKYFAYFDVGDVRRDRFPHHAVIETNSPHRVHERNSLQRTGVADALRDVPRFARDFLPADVGEEADEDHPTIVDYRI